MFVDDCMNYFVKQAGRQQELSSLFWRTIAMSKAN